ncbi:MAG: hypothetical protein AB8B68_01315 [Rickettsiaceae bacterium]
MASINALKEQISNYDKIAKGEALTPKDFENILKDMQPLVDNALRHNNDNRAMNFFDEVISDAPNLSKEEQDSVFYNMQEQTEAYSAKPRLIITRFI